MLEASIVDENVALTRGYNMAFGVMSEQIYQIMNIEVFDTLLKNSVPKGKESDDAETRKFAIKSLSSAIKRWGPLNLSPDTLKRSIETFYQGMNDYQIDRRGDVGSWVREESMLALNDFIQLIQLQEYQALREALGATHHEFYARFISALLQQLCEKIDKVREVAGRTLQEFFKKVAIPHGVLAGMESADQLAALFTSNDHQGGFGVPVERVVSEAVGYLPWRNAEFVFTSIRPFFDSNVFSISIFKGLITSSGGLTESTLKASSNSLFEYLSSMKEASHKKIFLGKLIKIFELNLKDERVTVPLMKTIEMVRQSLNPTLEIQGLVLTMYDRRSTLSGQVAADVRSHFGDKVYDAVIPRNVRVAEAPSFGKPALIYDLKCAGSQAYLRLAREVVAREKSRRLQAA